MALVKTSLLIARRELAAMFVSPIAYVVLSGYAVLSGWIFFNLLARFLQVSGVYMQFAQRQPELLQQLNLMEMIVQPAFLNQTILLVILFPLLTMRLVAEERRQNTDELLLTSPITTGAIVLGKYVALLVVFVLMLAMTISFPAILLMYGDPAPALSEIGAAYLGLLLLGMAFGAVGMFTSSITTNQIVAAVSCFVVLLLIYVIDWIGASAGGTVREVLEYISIVKRYQEFVRGMVDLQSIVYALSFVVLGLFLSKAAMDSLRLRSN